MITTILKYRKNENKEWISKPKLSNSYASMRVNLWSVFVYPVANNLSIYFTFYYIIMF